MKRKIISIALAALTAATLCSCSVIQKAEGLITGEESKSPEEQREEWLVSVKNKSVDQMDGIKTQTVVEWNEGCTVWAAYPVIDGMEALNTELSQFVNNKIELFKAEAAKYTCEGAADRPSLIISYKPYNYSDYSISFKFQTYANSGISVTDNYIETFAYNRADFAPLALSELFAEGSDYLTAISESVRAKLKENSVLLDNYDEEKFLNGTAPDESNFSAFVIDSDKLVFYFNRQTIAPAAAGNFEAAISFSELNGILSPQFLEGVYASPEAAEAETTQLTEEELSNMPEFLVPSDDSFMTAHSLDGIDPINDKVIAMTFDDGPGEESTTYLLDHLKELGVKVTFMVLGERASAYPDIVARAYSEGHELGDHSYNHVDYKTVSTDEMISEIAKANDAIEAACGKRTLLGRAPYGSITEDMAQATGRASVLWSVDTEDWKNRQQDNAVELNYNAVMTAKDGDVVLMHDIYMTSVEAAVQAIADLQAEGYKFVTVSQMIQIAKIRGEEVHYRFFGANQG